MIYTDLKYLEITKAIRSLPDNAKKESIRIYGSRQYAQLYHYIKGCAAVHGVELNITSLEYDELKAHLVSGAIVSENLIYLLGPWDFSPLLDWRIGIPRYSNNIYDKYQSEANFFHNLLLKNAKKSIIFYLDAPLPACGLNYFLDNNIRGDLRKRATDLGCFIIPETSFSLENYLNSGSPYSTSSLYKIALSIFESTYKIQQETKKIIITDLDYTYWKGVLGEDGLECIMATPEGEGYIYYIYQTLLLRLKNLGFLIAAVSKNDQDMVELALRSDKFLLNRHDFVSVIASYEPKSDQIKNISTFLNLGLDSFVFIDDNPLELAAVKKSLPEVCCIQFPNNATDMLNFIQYICNFFQKSDLSNEDLGRTELYKNLTEGLTAEKGKLVDLTSFLQSMKMKLNIYDGGKGDFKRALQLLNKTNQFNMNGIRIKESHLIDVLRKGGRIFTAELVDVNGSHGEVIVIFLDVLGNIISYVMSCRVFSRKIEFVFVASIVLHLKKSIYLNYIKTDRNSPFGLFISEIGLEDQEFKLIDLILASNTLTRYESIIQVNFQSKIEQ